MTCDEFLKIDASTPEAETHREACPACGRTERVLRAFGRAELDPPAGLAEEVLAAVHAPARTILYEIRRFALAAAAAVALAVGVYASYDVEPVVGRVGEELRWGLERVKEIPRTIEQGILGLLEKGRDS
jgi:ferric-dicitrate binding protein FerR (iron transport regulator)